MGVAAARQGIARLRGLTLFDTRRVEAALNRESAVFATMEQSRQASTERCYDTVRAGLAKACLDAGLDFDIRRTAGDPLLVLPREARFHDLVITSANDESLSSTSESDLTAQDLLALVERGVQPLLVVRPEQRGVRRVLLTYDGSAASGRAIRSFLGLGIYCQAEHRLLAIGRDEHQARATLREMADYCIAHRPSLETGCLAGKSRRVLSPYAKKWQADLTVIGLDRNHGLLRRMFGSTSLDLWKNSSCALYVNT